MADEKDKKERHGVHGRDFTVEGNDVLGYVGVSPEYRTYANDTEKPYVAEGELVAIHAGGQLLDIEHAALQERAADNGGTVEPSVVALAMNQEEDRKVTNVVVPEGTTTKTGETSRGKTVDAEGNEVGDSEAKPSEEKSSEEKPSAPAKSAPASAKK